VEVVVVEDIVGGQARAVHGLANDYTCSEFFTGDGDVQGVVVRPGVAEMGESGKAVVSGLARGVVVQLAKGLQFGLFRDAEVPVGTPEIRPGDLEVSPESVERGAERGSKRKGIRGGPVLPERIERIRVVQSVIGPRPGDGEGLVVDSQRRA